MSIDHLAKHSALGIHHATPLSTGLELALYRAYDPVPTEGLSLYKYCQAQGYYHSHPAQNFVENIFGALSGLTNEVFSGYGIGSADPAPGDRQWADRKCKPLSLVTSSGKMKTYNPDPAKAGNGTINNHGVVPKP